MEHELTIISFTELALILLAFGVIAASRRLRQQRRASRRLPWRTDDTVQAERASEEHDRDTQSAEPGMPAREDRPLRPGPDNLKRFN